MELPINPSGLALQLGEEKGNQVFDEVLGRLFDQYERQNLLLLHGSLLGSELWASVPPFHYEPPRVTALLREQAFAILVLLAWLGAAALYAWRGAALLAPR